MEPIEEVYSFLELLTSVPVAPFYENSLIARLLAVLPKLVNRNVSKIAGGIIVQHPDLDLNAPKLFLSAHLDHPGFHIYGNNSKEAVARKMGRIEAKNGMSILGYGADAEDNTPLTEGRLKQSEDSDYFSVKWNHPSYGVNFAIVKTPTLNKDNKYVHCRSLDDHIGCALILAAIKNSKRENIVALLNTAEEEGMIGSLKNMENRIISNKDIVLSIEATPNQKEARMGNGAVIREGDALEKFTPEVVGWLEKLSSKLPYGYQTSRPVSGNTEGAVYASFGKKVAGISVPINNYHNKNMMPESAKISDIISAFALLSKAMEKFNT